MIETENGKVRGQRNAFAFSFRGIPYAADTGGRHRFLAPQPAPRWAGVRDALTQGDRCPQTVEGIGQIPVFAWYAQNGAFSENCCVLNVFTPDPQPGARRPVIFYLHGGGYASGSSNGPAVDGSRLAAFGDVVVVTVNHRLNVFGFTNLSHLDDERFGDAGHAGLLDVVAALRWVRRNIAAFGGDADNVTLMGESGGGNKAMVLLTMPAARGLFCRAINMSGASGLRLARPGQVAPYVEALLQELNIRRGELQRLQELPVEVLQQARQKAMAAVRGEGAQPVVDGRHVLASPFTPEGLALHACVPLMMGTTDTEATLFLGMAERRNLEVDERELKARLQAQFGLDASAADALIDAYRQDGPQRSAADILAYLASDVLARGALIEAVQAKAQAGQAAVYLYNFTWRVPQEGGAWRSPHAADIPFAFGTLDSARCMTGDDAAAAEVSRNMMAAVVAFARTGNPDNERMPHWKPYDAQDRATMVLDAECRLVDDFRSAGRIASAPHLAPVPTSLVRGPLFRGLR
jgi:para-nitrobenzyl esterase